MFVALYEFKDTTFTRGHRIQNVEDSFKFGMQFTNTPLPEGYLKNIVNYDIFNEGASLKPRPGLRTTTAFIPEESVDSRGTEQIIAAREQYVGTKAHAQFFLKRSMSGIPGVLRKGSLRMLTSTGSAATEGFSDLPTGTYVSESYNNVNYVVPENAEIHGIALSNTELLARHVGCYAWNNNYYFFDPVAKKLVHTEWDEEEEKFVYKTNDPKVLTSKEAAMWGYNALADNPYAFTNTEGTDILVFTGMLPYDSEGELTLTPLVNQSLVFKAYYTLNKGPKYDIKWEWRSINGDVWTELKKETLDFTDTLHELSCDFSPPEEGLILRISAYGYTEGTVNNYSDQVLAVGFSFNKEDYGSTANIKTQTYDLYNATGMTYWQNRLMVWGVAEDSTMLFSSDVNDPTYFPYPNNCDKFDEPIKFALPFLDKLLVFTATKLYMLVLNKDGLSWSTSCIQSNLMITDWDIHLIQVIKNMVFFKSGNYYYMIVPKASSTIGELALAAVSKPMQYFFDHFTENIVNTMRELYNYSGPLNLVHYYNYLDFEDVHNVYVYKTDTEEYLHYNLLYNTVNRSWRSYVIGSQSLLTPYKSDATQRGTLCSLASLVEGETTVAVPQLLKYSANNNNKDFYIPLNTTLETASEMFAAQHWITNRQFLDTGYREHQSNFKKRYREMQFVINNISNQALRFYTDFFIDGEQRKSKYRSEIVHNVDPDSPEYGIITVEQVLVDPPELVAPSATMLGESEEDTEAWMLDSSMFPDVAYWKARFQVSGKGYTPRFYLTCHSEANYELLNISWVYRALYSR